MHFRRKDVPHNRGEEILALAKKPPIRINVSGVGLGSKGNRKSASGVLGNKVKKDKIVLKKINRNVG